MRHEITKTDYEAAMSGDLAEMFEMMAKQTAYLDVVAVSSDTSTHGIVAVLFEFEPGTGAFYNASCFWQHDGTSYAWEKALDAGTITARYFAYDTVADAVAHANELLAKVDDAI